jgi:long-chain acyl-CoA synthetase
MNPITPDMTIPDLLRNVVKNIHPESHPFLLHKTDNHWEEISYKMALDIIDSISAYFLSIGIKKGDRLALLIDNSPQYVYFDQALQQIGAINVSVYPTLPESEIEYILNDSGAKAILVGNPFLLRKLIKIVNDCREMTRIIPAFSDFKKLVKGDLQAGVISLSTVIEQGKKALPEYQRAIVAARESILTSDISTLIYTSGTTGIPKGVMLTHSNLVNNVRVSLDQIPVITKDELFLSFLPLSHVFERTATYHVCLATGSRIAFAQSLELLARNMEEVKPTVLNCVPRLLERIYEKAMKSGTESGNLKAKIFLWALDIGQKYRETIEDGLKPGFFLSTRKAIAEKLVFSKIKAKTGGRLKFMISGGGALPKNIGEFFGNLGIKILEGFGLTETSPVVAVTEYDRQVYGTVGRVVPEIEIAIQNYETGEIYTVQTYDSFQPEFESPEGEILIRGHCIMKGYWNKPEETANVIDSDRWFHTGDIGRFYKGNLQITDRLKNMLVNSYGKNIYPTPIENVYLKSNKIDQIFLLGDKREYVTAIIVPSKERLQESFGLGEEFFERPEVTINDQGIIDWINQDLKNLSNELAKFERIRNFVLKRTPFTIEDGEITPTLKAKRKVIEKKYAELIEGLYKSHQTS